MWKATVSLLVDAILQKSGIACYFNNKFFFNIYNQDITNSPQNIFPCGPNLQQHYPFKRVDEQCRWLINIKLINKLLHLKHMILMLTDAEDKVTSVSSKICALTV